MIKQRLLPWAWLVVTLGLALVVWRWAGTPGAVDSDILALLPARAHADLARPDLVSQAQTRIADSAARRVIVLVGGGELESALRAADASHTSLAGNPVFSRITYRIDPARAAAMRDFYAPHHPYLLSAAQRAALLKNDHDDLLDQALRGFYSPLGTPGGLTLKDDPFQRFADWQRERGEASRLRPLQDRLVAIDGERYYVAILLEIAGSAFDPDVQEAVASAIAQAQRAAGQAELMSAGVINFATAVQRQAQREVSLIGVGSTLGIVLMIWATFRSFRPLILALLPVLVGCLAAIAVSGWLFGRIHVLTLVFGASLVGVSVDYGLHFLCHVQASDTRTQRFTKLRLLLPGLSLALVTSVVAYLTLAIPAFPGLRQMAVFSAVGLCCAWLTTLLWLPGLARGGVQWEGIFPRALQSLRRRSAPSRMSNILLLVLTLGTLFGITRLKINDDVRLLQSTSPALIAQQQRIAALAGVPSPAQFLLVQADTAQAVLQIEEALRVDLDRARAQNLLGNYQAVSLWLPSALRQAEDHRLLEQRLYASGGLLDQLGKRLTSVPASFIEISRSAHTTATPLNLADWLASPVSEAQRILWLGKMGDKTVSVITLQDIKGQDGAHAIQDSAQKIPGVHWVDRAADFSQALADYRREMTEVAAVAYALVFAALAWRYRRAAWRAIAPTVLATLLTLGLLGWLAVPVNLFTVLALLLVLGVGIDYGIYMQEERAPHNNAAWLGVSLSALTTLLSFGLLALSKTPALQTFGLTMLVGVGLAWWLAQVFAEKT